MASRRGLIEMRMEGAAELAAALYAMGQDRLIRATMRRALLEVAQPIAADAKARAPRSAGGEHPHMADRITVSATLSRRQRAQAPRGSRIGLNTAEVFVGAAPRGAAVLAEFGTGPRRTKRTGAYRGIMAATPFMRPAWESHKDGALRDFAAALGRQIEASARRLARRQARLIAEGNRR